MMQLPRESHPTAPTYDITHTYSLLDKHLRLWYNEYAVTLPSLLYRVWGLNDTPVGVATPQGGGPGDGVMVC